MGCSEGDTACNDDEKPSHRVTITKAFANDGDERRGGHSDSVCCQGRFQARMGRRPDLG